MKRAFRGERRTLTVCNQRAPSRRTRNATPRASVKSAVS
jgi:hypothetical protein